MVELGRSHPDKPSPTADQIVAFNKACLQLNHITDEIQWSTFATAAEQMQNAGWTPVQVVEGLWNVRPDVRPEGKTAAEVVAELIKIQMAEERAQRAEQAARRKRITKHPLGTTVPELEFHASIIQISALYGETIVVRDVEKPHVDNLPSNVPAADPRKPFYLSPGELFRAGSQE